MIPHEEKRTVKLFLIISYLIFIGYDLFYYFIYPYFIVHKAIGPQNKLYFVTYFVLGTLIPIIHYLNKIDKQYWSKYVFILGYVSVSLVVDILIYSGRGESFFSGNIVEVFLILSTPLFINMNYFRTVTLSIALKYTIIGIVLNTTNVIVAMVMVLILSIVSFFLLVRFKGYVKAISSSYDNQLQGIVKGVIATLELKDPYTRGHSERVANYALLLAKETEKFTKEEQKSFYYACLLHDIGKVHIPDSILTKPGKLTKDEFEIIKIHPVVGAEAVKDVEGIKDCISVIRSHHERWDGKGYPDQLNGEEIPIVSRIAAIADAFDAMTSSRSYRAALPTEEAYKRIVEGKGSQFDPILVDKFKEVFPAWVDYHNNYPWNIKKELLREVE